MMYTLQNSFLQLSVNPAWATWSLVSNQTRGPVVENAHLGIYYRQGSSRFKLPGDAPLEGEAPETVDTPHGLTRQISLSSGRDANGVRCGLVFAIPHNHNFLMIKAAVENGSSLPIRLERIEFLNAGFVFVPMTATSLTGYSSKRSGDAPSGRVKLAPELGDLAFFSNGWQSWNYTGVHGMGSRFRRTRLGPFTSPMRVNPGTPHPKARGLFGSDMFGVLGDRQHRTAVLAGFLSQEQHFGSLEALTDPFRPALRMWANGDNAELAPGDYMETDWAYVGFLHLDQPDALGTYMEAVARQNAIAPKTGDDILAGWCSWYYFFQKIDADLIRQNLGAAADLRPDVPLELFQIDDGFESQVGDWFSFAPGFPHGVAPLAESIRAAGFKPGLWLAPFIVHPRSRLAQEHPDWLLRGRFGRPANAGYVWDVFNHALDLTVPEALDYASQVVKTAVHEWGFPFLKLDFLYAAALPGTYRDPSKTRAQVLRMGLEALRKAAGDETYLLGCGCPLGPALGLVDAMRIGADVDQRWHPAYKGIQFFFKPEPDFPSARNAIQNALTRAPMHRRWWVNDPDCLLVRPSADGRGLARLTLPEIQSLATVVALSGGSLLISENLPDVPPERMRIIETLLPLIGKAPHVLDWFDSATPSRLQIDMNTEAGRWRLIALFNWADQPCSLEFKPNEFYFDGQPDLAVRSFWDGRLDFVDGKGSSPPGLAFPAVAAHGVALLAVRTLRKGQPLYLGSDLHISQGMEVVEWHWPSQPDGETRRLTCRLERPGSAAGLVDLYLPSAPRQAHLNGQPAPWEPAGEDVYRFLVRFEKSGDLQIDV